MKRLKGLFLVSIFIICISFFNIESFAAPAAPDGLAQYEDDFHSVMIKWNPVNGANKYFVEWSLDGKEWVVEKEVFQYVLSTEFRCEIKYLDSGTSYYARVRAYTGEFPNDYNSLNVQAQGNVSAASKVLEVTTRLKLKDTVVRQINATENTIELEWDAVKDATHYEIIKSKEGEDNKIIDIVETNSTVIVNQSPSDKFVIYLRPFRKTSSGYSTTNGSWCGGLMVYTAPQKINKPSVDWSGMNATGISKYSYSVGWRYIDATGYQVEYCDMDGKPLLTQEEGDCAHSQIILPNELRSKSFKFRVRAFQELEDGKIIRGAWSSYKTVVPYAEIVKGKALGKGKARFSWKKIEGATSYTVYLASKSTGKYKKIATTKKNSYTVRKLKRKKNYYLFVSAKVKIGKNTFRTNLGSLYHDYYGFRLKK